MINRDIRKRGTSRGAVGKSVFLVAGIPVAVLLVILWPGAVGNAESHDTERETNQHVESSHVTDTQDGDPVTADHEKVMERVGKDNLLWRWTRNSIIQPLDTISGYVLCDKRKRQLLVNSDIILLDFVREHPESQTGEYQVLIGWYNLWCPANRAYSASFTVLEVQLQSEVERALIVSPR